MTKCPECDKEASDAAKCCPRCGHPLRRSRLKAIAGAMVALITAAAVVAIVVVVLVNSDEAKERWRPIKLGKSYETGETRTFAEIEFVWIPPGTFQMGSPSVEIELSFARPVHTVTISRGLWLGKYEVTKGEWKAVMGTEPWKGNRHVHDDPRSPVFVNWEDAQDFIRKLNNGDEGHFRLPTEAQWEYACRAGTQTRFYYGDDPDHLQLGQYAWYQGNAEGVVHRVGQKKPNAWGLYDMHGNAWEHCEDWFDRDYYSKSRKVDPKGPAKGSMRVLRGGAYHNDAVVLPSWVRNSWEPAEGYFGFRVARDP